ncbi:PAS domain S-box protein [Collimonas sp. H4R21]|uniref:PAS domain S-box protein n=1 Tax=Collimonas rhizosphaerae TaxID=3126357 RepID=A0ABU9PP93_9BURK
MTSMRNEPSINLPLNGEDFFKRIFERSATASMIVGPDQTFLALNGAMCAFLGHEAEELIGKHFTDILHPDDRLSIQDAFDRLIHDTADGLCLESRYIRKNGQIIQRMLRISPVREECGGLLYFFSQLICISELASPKKPWLVDASSLASSDEFVGEPDLDIRPRDLALAEFTLNQLNDSLVLIDQHARFHYVNDAACRALNYSRSELLRMGVADIDPDWPAARWPECFDYIRIHGSNKIETRHQAKDGRTFPVEVSARYFEYQGRSYNVALVRDITERKRTEELLHKREQEFRALVENSPDTIVRYDRECRRMYVNPALTHITGIPAHEMLGKTPVEFKLNYNGTTEYQHAIKQVLQSGVKQETELFMHSPDGKTSCLQFQLMPELDPNGQVISVLSLGRDITALKESEMRLRTLVENLPDFISRFDLQGRHTYVNPSAAKACGQSAQYFIGKTLHELQLDPDEQLGKYLKETIRLGAPHTIENRRMTPDGERLFEIRFIPKKNGFGSTIGVLAIGRDITERKQADELLRKREQEFRTLAENLPDLVVRYDRNCRRTYVNPAYEQETGIPARQSMNKMPDAKWRTGISGEEFNATLCKVMETRIPAQIFLRGVKAELQTADYAFHVVAECNPDGEVIGALAIGKNVTVLKETQRRLEESQLLLRQLAAHNETAREDERRHLSREIHDELGQCLSALRMGMSVLELQYNEDHASSQAIIQRMITLVDSTIRIVRNLVTWLRPTALDMGIVPALEWLVEEFSRGHPGIRCMLYVVEEDIHLDEKRATEIFRITQESLTNISRHADATEVQIAFKRKESHYLLEVRDNGKGFNSLLQKKQSFGLIGVRERVLMLEGEVEISSMPDQGTIIRVSIPVHKKLRDS